MGKHAPDLGVIPSHCSNCFGKTAITQIEIGEARPFVVLPVQVVVVRGRPALVEGLKIRFILMKQDGQRWCPAAKGFSDIDALPGMQVSTNLIFSTTIIYVNVLLYSCLKKRKGPAY